MDIGTKITVVIPTIGENSLSETLASLHNSTVVPHRVLLCIPVEFEANVRHFESEYWNVEVVALSAKGQVRQRAAGFSMSRSEYTLQLDSDVTVTPNLIGNLVQCLQESPGSSVGPVLQRESSSAIYSFLSKSCDLYTSWQKFLIAFILNGTAGYIPGKVSLGGVGFGPDLNEGVSVVEWMPGCCILHETQNLVLGDYYQRDGKAYAEDLFHSYILGQKGVRLLCDSNTVVCVGFPELGLKSSFSIFKGHCIAYLAGLAYVKLANKSRLRFSIYTAANMVFLFFNKLFRK